MLTLTLPDINFSWLVWFALIPFFDIIYREKPLKAFFYGWLTGIVYMGGASYWLIVLPKGEIALSVYCLFYGIYYGFFAALMSWAISKKPKNYIIIALSPLLWATMEWLRSLGFMGYTWINIGHCQYNFLPFIQIASITGVSGISFIIVMVNELIRELVSYKKNSFFKSKTLKKNQIAIFASLVFIILILNSIFGIIRLNTGIPETTGTKFAVIQPNIDQSIKWDRHYTRQIIDKYIRMTREAAQNKPDIILWPETAVPTILLKDTSLTGEFSNLAREVNSYLMIGTVDQDPNNLIYNTAVMFTPRGTIDGQYSKIHLVPFGEYLPGRKYMEHIPYLKNIVKPISRFSPGKDFRLFKTPKLNFSVVICFESIFPDISKKCMNIGAEAIVLLTNDAWFERTSSPYQHHIISVFRAIENRTFFVSCANTGVSGVIDPCGRILQETPIYEDRIFYAHIYPNKISTFYSYMGDIFSILCFILSGGIIIHIKGRKEKELPTFESIFIENIVKPLEKIGFTGEK